VRVVIKSLKVQGIRPCWVGVEGRVERGVWCCLGVDKQCEESEID